MSHLKQERIIQRLENHLRMTSRQLIKMDTEEEAIQFLIDSFKSKFYCDFVGVVLEEQDQFILKTRTGNMDNVKKIFPLTIQKCSPLLLIQSLHNNETEKLENCAMTEKLKASGVKTWFTVPLMDDVKGLGYCIIGFFTYVPLLEMDRIFDEFGKDVAVAISLARRKDQQSKKIEGIEWISRNLSIDRTLEGNISEFTSRAAKGTNAASACIYLYNEKDSCFELQKPVFGAKAYVPKVYLNHNNALIEYFSYLEQAGGRQLTIPIVIDLKTIGVLHIEDKNSGLLFSEDDVNLLKLLSEHIAVLLKNAQLYNAEKDHRERLQLLLDYQQALVKETVVHDDFHGVTEMLSEMYACSVILLDRFFRPLSYKLEESDHEMIERFMVEAEQNRIATRVFKVFEEEGRPFSVWPVNGVNALLGYLALRIDEAQIDEFDRLTVELARNICSIQFIKQKLVLDANEQAKDTLMSKLLVETIEDEQSILQYANLFQWNIYQPHRVANLSINLNESEVEGLNLLEQKSKKSIVWDYITDEVIMSWQGVMTATFNEHYLFIVPVKEINKRHQFWAEFYKKIQLAVSKSTIDCEVHLGIGSRVEELKKYYSSYEQSLQVLNVVKNRFQTKGYALFEELGSYTLLHHLHHPVVNIFMENQLGTLLSYSEEKNIDLFHTLSVYLRNNGNAKGTSEELFIHRSSLIYRLEKIESLLDVDLNDSETRFNLMMAIKLYDMNRQAYS